MLEEYWLVVTNRYGEADRLTLLDDFIDRRRKVSRRQQSDLLHSTTDDGRDSLLDVDNNDEIVLREPATADLERLARRRVSQDQALATHEATIFSEQPDANLHLTWVVVAPAARIVLWASTYEATKEAE